MQLTSISCNCSTTKLLLLWGGQGGPTKHNDTCTCAVPVRRTFWNTIKEHPVSRFSSAFSCLREWLSVAVGLKPALLIPKTPARSITIYN